MDQKAAPEKIQQDQIGNLTRMVEFFTSATQDFKEAYRQLERQVTRLNQELARKNDELQTSLQQTESLQNYLSNILASMDAGVICTDMNGLITVFNRAAASLTGYSADEVIGKKYNDLFAVEISDFTQPQQILQRREKMIHHEKHLQRKDGTMLPVKFSMALLQSENREAIGVVEVFEDLTEIRKLEREIQHGRTLIALGEMAGHVAHKIRNPLGAIAGFAALLERDLGEDDPRQRLVRKIIEGVGNMDHIIGNLVFLARPVQPSMRKVNLKWLLGDVVDHVAYQAKEEGKKIQFDRKIPKSKIEMMADPHLFQQMFLHLLRNATQAIEQEGKVSIQLQHKADQEIRVTIRDNGIGMPAEIQSRLFYPFTSNKQKSTGLGLPIVHKIVELHQGNIQVKSTVREGTKVVLVFPSGF